MKRRTFVTSTLATTGALLLGTAPKALAQPTTASGRRPAVSPNVCAPESFSFVSAEATYHARYEHFHLLSVPVSVLIEAPEAGYQVRTTVLDQTSLEEDAFSTFIEQSGLNYDALRVHSHMVKFTQDELLRIGRGDKDVEIVVMTPGGNLGHKFYFTAHPAIVTKVKRARG